MYFFLKSVLINVSAAFGMSFRKGFNDVLLTIFKTGIGIGNWKKTVRICDFWHSLVIFFRLHGTSLNLTNQFKKG